MRKNVHYIHPSYVGITDNDVVRSRRRRRALRQTVLVLLCLLGTSGIIAMGKFHGGDIHDVDRVVANEQPADAAKQTPVVAPLNSAAMGQSIDQIISRYPNLQIGVAITDLRTGNSYHHGVQDGFLGASTIKLISAVLFLQKVEQGKYTLQTQVSGHSAEHQLKQLIEQSDNDAWMGFIRLLGGSNIQKWTDTMSLKSFNHNQNIINVDDMAKFLAKLHKGELLIEANTQLLLEHMGRANRPEFIMSAVPEGVAAYHKAGWLEDRVHDAAIIDDGKRPYVLVIYTKANGAYDQAEGRKLFQDITASTLEAFIAKKP